MRSVCKTEEWKEGKVLETVGGDGGRKGGYGGSEVVGEVEMVGVVGTVGDDAASSPWGG